MSSTTATTSLWTDEEFGRVHFGDARLDRRVLVVARQRALKPASSLPGCHDSWGALKGTYRFFANDLVSMEIILESHRACSLDRVRGEPVILAVQDSSQLDYSTLEATKGLGPLQSPEHQGLMLHSVLGIRPDRLPVGVLHARVWARSAEEFGKTAQRRKRPLEDKESNKWILGLEEVAKLKAELGETLVVHVADREADIYDFMKRSLELEAPVLVRGSWDRGIAEPEGRLWAFMEEQPVQGHHEVLVQRQADHPARCARLSLRYAPVTLLPPRHRRTRALPVLHAWAVLAREETAPADSEPIEWLLLSTLPVTSIGDAQRNVEWYACRWTIEMYHKVLKSGCQIEERRLSDVERLKRYLAIDLVVAWRVLYTTLAGRQTPEMPCTAVLEQAEWQALCCYINKEQTPPQQPPTLGQAMRLIAQLGGFLARKADGHPGTQTIWRGMMRLADIAESWRRFGPPAAQRCG